MTLPIAGKIAFSQISTEAKLVILSPVAFNDLELRKLVNKKELASTISAQDFYGKTYGLGPGYSDTDFVAQYNCYPSYVVTSNKVGAQADSYIAIICDQPVSYRINGGDWTDKSVLGNLVKDDIVELQVTTPATYNTALNVSVKFGPSSTKIFSISTGIEKRVDVYIHISGTKTLWGTAAYGSDSPTDPRGGKAAISITATPLASVTYTDIGDLEDLLGISQSVNILTGTVTSYTYSSDYRIYRKGYISCMDTESPIFPAVSSSIQLSEPFSYSVGDSDTVGYIANGVHRKLSTSVSIYCQLKAFSIGATYKIENL